MSSVPENAESLRYERKFLLSDHSFQELLQIVHFHPACFREIFSGRQVNNIYFDTPGLDHYYDNVEGSPQRMKVRIRWYGDLFGKIEKPVLELKIRNGLMGQKRSAVLAPFTLDAGFDRKRILQAATELDPGMRDQLLSLSPTLLNSYKRRYFLSGDNRFRITLDHDLSYYRISYHSNTFVNSVTDRRSVVLELKYNKEDETDAEKITSAFPFALTKSSKYLQGLERTFIY